MFFACMSAAFSLKKASDFDSIYKAWLAFVSMLPEETGQL
jgi:hypothetical protein